MELQWWTTDISLVFASDNKFIPTEVSTSTLRIPFKVKFYCFFPG